MCLCRAEAGRTEFPHLRQREWVLPSFLGMCQQLTHRTLYFLYLFKGQTEGEYMVHVYHFNSLYYSHYRQHLLEQKNAVLFQKCQNSITHIRIFRVNIMAEMDAFQCMCRKHCQLKMAPVSDAPSSDLRGSSHFEEPSQTKPQSRWQTSVPQK